MKRGGKTFQQRALLKRRADKQATDGQMERRMGKVVDAEQERQSLNIDPQAIPLMPLPQTSLKQEYMEPEEDVYNLPSYDLPLEDIPDVPQQPLDFSNLPDIDDVDATDLQYGLPSEGYDNPFNDSPTIGNQLFDKNIGWLEGTKEHEDVVGISTLPFGLRKDLHGEATKGFTMQQYKDYAQDVFNDNIPSTQKLPEWETLSDEGRFVVRSAEYNTGKGFPKLTKALNAYEKYPSLDRLRKAVTETTRLVQEKGMKVKQRTTGMDNRALRELVAAGYIDLANPKHVKIVEDVLDKADVPSVRNGYAQMVASL